MASVILSSGVVVGHQSLVTNGAYTGYDLTKSGSFPGSGYRVTGATLTCTLRNAKWDAITVQAEDGTVLGSFGAVGTSGERACALTTAYDYAGLTHTHRFATGSSGLPAVLLYIGDNSMTCFINIIIALVISAVVTAAVTWVLSMKFEKKEG